MNDYAGWNGPGRHDTGTAAGWIKQQIRSLDQRLAQQERGAPLRAAGIGMSPEGLTVYSSLNVEGSLDVSGTQTIGGSLTATGDTEIGGDLKVTGTAEFSGDTTIGGNAAITGTLSLPSGIIDNDALVSPVTFDRAGGGGAGFDIPPGVSDLPDTISVTVPDGYTAAIVWATWTVAAENTGSGAARLTVGAKIGDVDPNRVGSVIPAGGELAVSGTATRTLTDLTSGSSIVSRASVNSNGTTTWNGNTYANGDMIAIFLR